jgi:S-adenosylmethionine:tRNA ribosyltransferase-isomerase
MREDPLEYDYTLPEKNIALTPAEPRDSAKLLVYDPLSERVETSTFAHLAEYLPRGALLVCNDTKVFPARIHVKRTSGGIVELLCTKRLGTHVFEAIGNRRIKKDERLHIAHHTLVCTKTSDVYTFESPLPNHELFEKYGETPIPPYLKNTSLKEASLRERYQSIFARDEGSIAAPTASLHITPHVLTSLKQGGIEIKNVTLHVNLGTFAPLTEEALERGELHEESYTIPSEAAASINRAKKEGRPILALGTTVLRTLESAANEDGTVEETSGTTRLFIRPGYRFRVVSGLITNFHVPRSSLMMLVAALVGREKLLNLYEIAKREDFRFFSFGDGMLVLPK